MVVSEACGIDSLFAVRRVHLAIARLCVCVVRLPFEDREEERREEGCC